jgi:hypothetical protein
MRAHHDNQRCEQLERHVETTGLPLAPPLAPPSRHRQDQSLGAEFIAYPAMERSHVLFEFLPRPYLKGATSSDQCAAHDDNSAQYKEPSFSRPPRCDIATFFYPPVQFVCFPSHHPSHHFPSHHRVRTNSSRPIDGPPNTKKSTMASSIPANDPATEVTRQEEERLTQLLANYCVQAKQMSDKVRHLGDNDEIFNAALAKWKQGSLCIPPADYERKRLKYFYQCNEICRKEPKDPEECVIMSGLFLYC